MSSSTPGPDRPLRSLQLRPPSTRGFAKRSISLGILVTIVAILAATLAATPAQAEVPWWRLTARTVPTHIAPGGEGTIIVQALNLGNAQTVGAYAFTDNLPAGLTVQEVEYFAPLAPALELPPGFNMAALGYCKTMASSVTCSTESEFFAELPEPEHAEFLLKPVVPYESLEMRIKVKNEGAESEALNEVGISGGGAQPRSIKRPVPIS